MLDNFKKFVLKNKKEVLVLCVILLLGAFFRLYKIDQYLTFLGDEGRDVLIIRRFLVNGDIFLIGPGTSIGNMYLGPFYYYMMAPALFLANYSPVGPAVQIAVLGILTIAFVWWVGREWFGKEAGLIAALLYAIAPTVIIYSRSSWNPNIMPFFALLCIYGMWRVMRKDTYIWLPVVGFSFAAVMQSHYLGVLLLPLIGLMWIFALWLHRGSRKKMFIYSTVAVVLFLALMSPLVIFDYRHNWINLEAFKKFVTERQTTVSAKPWNALPQVWPLWQKISSRIIAGRNDMLGSWIAALLIAGIVWVGGKQRRNLDVYKILTFTILVLWLLFALIGMGIYKQEIYDHYYGFIFPVPFLLFGGISYMLIKAAKIRGWWIVCTALVFLVYFNLADNPLRYSPNNQLGRSVAVAQKIEESSDGKPFNLAVIAERNYEDAYQYFLEKWGDKVIEIDPQKPDETITQQLYVVCELPEEKCDPTHNSKAGIANFGWSKIEKQWNISGVILYKLVHYDQTS